MFSFDRQKVSVGYLYDYIVATMTSDNATEQATLFSCLCPLFRYGSVPLIGTEIEVCEPSSNGGLPCYVHFHNNTLLKGIFSHSISGLSEKDRLDSVALPDNRFKRRKTLNYKTIENATWIPTNIFFRGAWHFRDNKEKVSVMVVWGSKKYSIKYSVYVIPLGKKTGKHCMMYQ